MDVTYLLSIKEIKKIKSLDVSYSIIEKIVSNKTLCICFLGSKHTIYDIIKGVLKY
jgi:hypothetical protein